MYFIIILIISSCNLINSNNLNINLRIGSENNFKEIDRFIKTSFNNNDNNYILVEYSEDPMPYRNRPINQVFYLFKFKNNRINNIEFYKIKNNKFKKISEYYIDLEILYEVINKDTVSTKNTNQFLKSNIITINYWIKLDDKRIFFSLFDNRLSNIEFYKGCQISEIISLYLSLGIIESELSQ